jgi:hypothetical protein
VIPLLLLHGGEQLYEFALGAAFILPVAFSILGWLAWWVRIGRYLRVATPRVLLWSGVAVLLFWLLELAAVVLGFGLVIALAFGVEKYADPDWDWGPAIPIGLFALPTVLLGLGLGLWARKGPR